MADMHEQSTPPFGPPTPARSSRRRRGVPDEQPLRLAYLLVVGLVVLVTQIVLNHPPREATWLLVILMAGLGQALLAPPAVGVTGSLLTLTAWLLFLQTAGVWGALPRPAPVLELAGLAALLLVTVAYRVQWQRTRQELTELRALRAVLVAGEAGTGLFPAEVAALRLNEEVDRAHTFGRPLGLMLVDIVPHPDQPLDDAAQSEISRALARQLTTVALVHDLPFRQGALRLGLIMPERDWEELYRDAEMVAEGLNRAVYADRDGRPRPVTQVVHLLFGLGTYNGELTGEIDLMRAAEDSLSVGRDLASIAQPSRAVHAMPAAPVVNLTRPAYEEDQT